MNSASASSASTSRVETWEQVRLFYILNHEELVHVQVNFLSMIFFTSSGNIRGMTQSILNFPNDRSSIKSTECKGERLHVPM